MVKRMMWGVGVAGSALLLVSGCAHESQEQPMNPARSAENTSAKALNDAHKSQQAALDAQKADEQAQQNLVVARNRLTDAEAKATAAHAQAQQAQVQASQETQTATQVAQQSQQQAQQTLQQQQQDRQQQTQSWHEDQAALSKSPTLDGQLVQANNDEIILKTQDQPKLSLKVDNNTQATLDGKQVSVTQLPQGAQVRASFEMQDGQYQARKIDAMSQ